MLNLGRRRQWTVFCTAKYQCLIVQPSGPSGPIMGCSWSVLHTWDQCLHFLQFSSITQSCLTRCDPTNCGTPGFSVYHQLPNLAQTHVHQVSDAIQPSHSLSSPSPLAFSLFQHQCLCQWVSSLHHVAKVLEYFSISPSNEYSGLISIRMDWLDLFTVQGTLTSLLQHHSSKASILWHSAFFLVQLLHPYMTTGKTTALTGWTFVSKVK